MTKSILGIAISGAGSDAALDTADIALKIRGKICFDRLRKCNLIKTY